MRIAFEMKLTTAAPVAACFEELFALCVLPLLRPRGGVSPTVLVEAMLIAWVCFAVWTPAKVRHRRGRVEE